MRRQIHPLARQEIDDAAGWYRERSLRTYRRFKSEVKATLDHINSDPTAVRYYRNKIQIHRLYNFPYALFFFVENEVIKLLALAHDARQQNYWLPRYQNWND